MESQSASISMYTHVRKRYRQLHSQQYNNLFRVRMFAKYTESALQGINAQKNILVGVGIPSYPLDTCGCGLPAF